MTVLPASVRLNIEPWRLAIWNVIGFCPHPGQVRAFHEYSNHRFVWTCAGRRGGKSEIAAAIAYSEFVRTPDTIKPNERWPKKILIIAPEYKQARIIFGKIYKLVKRHGIPLVTDRFSEQAMELETVWGSILMCMTGKNADAWPGFDWDLVIADEAPLFKKARAFHELLFPTLMDGRGSFFGIGTPDYPGSYSYQWKEWGEDPEEPRWGFAKWTSVENWYIPWMQEEIDNERRTTPEDIILRQYYAEYVGRSGLVYPEYVNCVTEFDLPMTGRFHRAIDFGFKNPFACLIVSQVSDALYFCDEFYAVEVHKGAIAPKLKEQDPRFPFRKSRGLNLADPEDPDAIHFFADWTDSEGKRIDGKWVTNYSKPLVMERIDLFRRWMAAGLIKINPRCTEFIKELSLYAYPERSELRNFTENPADKDDHGPDAASYLTDHLFRDSLQGVTRVGYSGKKRRSFDLLKGFTKKLWPQN